MLAGYRSLHRPGAHRATPGLSSYRLVEEVFEEVALLLFLVVARVVLRIEVLGVAATFVLVVLLLLRRGCRCCGRRWWGSSWLLSRSCSPGVLGADEVFEFPAVEEDSAAFRALIDVNSIAFVRAHFGLAFWTSHWIEILQVAAKATVAGRSGCAHR